MSDDFPVWKYAIERDIADLRRDVDGLYKIEEARVETLRAQEKRLDNAALLAKEARGRAEEEASAGKEHARRLSLLEGRMETAEQKTTDDRHLRVARLQVWAALGVALISGALALLGLWLQTR